MIEFSVYSVPKRSRLDQFLADCPGLIGETSRSQIRTWIGRGQILANGKEAKGSHRVKRGDCIELHYRLDPPEIEPEKFPLDILYEDDHLLVVNKPAGMLVHPASGCYSGTLVNALLGLSPLFSALGGPPRSGIVHRLDKETSGALIVAKSEEVSRLLSEQFKERAVHKVYLALAYGIFPESQGGIYSSIGRHPRDRKRMAIREKDGKIATTHWKVKSSFSGVTLVEVEPQTGRTHQIRIHLSSIHHPIVGDALYGGTEQRAKAATNPWVRSALLQMKRHALHAWKLSFQHPMTGEPLTFEAPLPQDFQEVCSRLYLCHPNPRVPS